MKVVMMNKQISSSI